MAVMERGSLPKRQAAEYVGVSERYLDKCVAHGELAKVKLGAKTVFRIAELERWLKANEVGAVAIVTAVALLPSLRFLLRPFRGPRGRRDGSRRRGGLRGP